MRADMNSELKGKVFELLKTNPLVVSLMTLLPGLIQVTSLMVVPHDATIPLWAQIMFMGLLLVSSMIFGIVAALLLLYVLESRFENENLSVQSSKIVFAITWICLYGSLSLLLNLMSLNMSEYPTGADLAILISGSMALSNSIVFAVSLILSSISAAITYKVFHLFSLSRS